jgi:hypothetical protein
VIWQARLSQQRIRRHRNFTHIWRNLRRPLDRESIDRPNITSSLTSTSKVVYFSSDSIAFPYIRLMLGSLLQPVLAMVRFPAPDAVRYRMGSHFFSISCCLRMVCIREAPLVNIQRKQMYNMGDEQRDKRTHDFPMDLGPGLKRGVSDLIVVGSEILAAAQIECKFQARGGLAGMCHTPCRRYISPRRMGIGKAQSVDADFPK